MPLDLTIFMAGLPGAGKTTLLAALWNTLRKTGESSDDLRLRAMPLDREYLYEIERSWLQLEQLDHTRSGEPNAVHIPLADAQDHGLDLEIPDISGETFDHMWEGSSWLESVSSLSNRASGLLLLVHSGAIEQPRLLEPDDDEEEKGGSDEEGGEEATNPPPKVWDAMDAPTQTKLCGLLEATEASRGTAVPTVVAVTAWDEALSLQLCPHSWLELHLPLLWQALEGGSPTRPFEIFGISAQGGDIRNPEDRKRLASVQPPSDRIRVQLHDTLSADITSPLHWLFERRL